MEIYRAPVVKSLRSYYGDILIPNDSRSIYSNLEMLSDMLHQGLQKKVDCLYTQINNHHTNYLGIPIATLKEKAFSLEECRHTIANEYGFQNWDEVQKLSDTFYNLDFENCVNYILSGELDALSQILNNHPEIVNHKSQYGHHATLLHYTASNGVELWRQQVPLNLPKIIEFLIQKGANKSAKMNVYGGAFTTYELYTTSAHPTAAE